YGGYRSDDPARRQGGGEEPSERLEESARAISGGVYSRRDPRLPRGQPSADAAHVLADRRRGSSPCPLLGTLCPEEGTGQGPHRRFGAWLGWSGRGNHPYGNATRRLRRLRESRAFTW